MNVTFKQGEKLTGGFTIKDNNGLTRFIAEDDNVIICFDTDAGEGINYSKIQWYTDKKTGKQYRAMRYLIKYVSLVQGFSNDLYTKYKQANK